MSSRDEQEEVFYQEEEVLWAKIRGYPWWPAFVQKVLMQVDKVHPPSRGKETEYTVFFFGDNTHSKLGASKLRKFYENYAEFYQKARAHRKLMTSIQMAEEKLKQNDQNVEIFEELRSNLKVAKKSKNNSIDRKSSKISEPDPQISVGKEELPDLNKSKTVPHTRRKKNYVHLDQQQQNSHSFNQSQKNQKTTKKKETVLSSQKKSKRQQPKKQISPLKKTRNSKEEIFQQQSQQQEPQKEVIQVQPKSKLPEPIPQDMQEEPQQQSEVAEQSIEQQEGRQQSSQDVVYQKKLRNSVKRKIQSQKHSVIGPRKRGRPKKKFLRHFHDEKIESLNRTSIHHRISHLKRKIIHKQKFSPKKIENNLTVLSQEDSLIIEQIKKILHKRDQLIDYLGSISITINNVQQILELGVSNILQEGDKNSKINELLFILRNVLLYKYFPDDIKHKKKYEKILKRKPITIKNDENEKEESQQNKESKEQQEIRKKTVVKLQKFLKMHPDIDNKAKQLAVRIQSYFQKADSGIGDRYKSIAFKVLSNLKEKKETFSEVIKKLDQNAYD